MSKEKTKAVTLSLTEQEEKDLIKVSKEFFGTSNKSGSALSDLAKEIYFKDVLVEKYRDNFLSELQKRKVIDKRENGFHCCYCSKISEKELAFVQTDRVIFPKNNELELWLVNSHYDGCRGWD